ncbi:uncharacterized protein SETTUDRAFT_142102 [Exserohilum turcica Et28A]|uniref:Uncharacterized protein n=1 Tax=Exserohilum turcicum (strain 28A) TaxID=671987 RepID=R0I9H6_EXST2|nr:uncharacterized protein SETTUDRAFT_142102 [Exserohilum turcica Et28A]EOA82120.1 hypothetical protein SETTUDRAFT_142102 [Exserohilum turcica Et28A]
MASPFRPALPAEDLPAYYQELDDDNIRYCFRDFDVERNFDLFDRQTRDPRSNNFCVDFGEDNAFCAFDLDAHAYEKLLSAPRPAELHTRWIHIWMPYNQKDLIRTLATHFDFTPRLMGLMKSDHVNPNSSRTGSSLRAKKSSSTLKSLISHKSQRSERAKQANEEPMDIESSIGLTSMMQSTQLEMVRDMSHYQLVNDVWHWSTVDKGRRYMCIGFNALHNIRTKPHQDHKDTDGTDRGQDVPQGKRVWNWLALCENKTVISISEDPFPFSNGVLSTQDLRVLFTTRRNLVNVFRQLTKAPTPHTDAALIQLPLRHRVGRSEEETAHRPTDSPGLLFYYLFEDWGATFDIISQREHGYELIIERVLRKQEATLASLKNSHILSGAASLASSAHQQMMHDTMALAGPLVPETDSLLGVPLSSAARVRFERLKDRIVLYALSEIQECLDQKDSLVMMNFNLIALKESYSVERLTWVTLLLAKITILFTPVTLMTGYFSIQFKDIVFEMGSYWRSFGYIFAASLALLVAFSWMSGTFEGKIITSSWTRSAFDGSRRWLAHRRRKRD